MYSGRVLISRYQGDTRTDVRRAVIAGRGEAPRGRSESRIIKCTVSSCVRTVRLFKRSVSRERKNCSRNDVRATPSPDFSVSLFPLASFASTNFRLFLCFFLSLSSLLPRFSRGSVHARPNACLSTRFSLGSPVFRVNADKSGQRRPSKTPINLKDQI